MGYREEYTEVSALVYFMAQRRKKLVIQGLQKSWVLNMLVNKARKLEFGGKVLEIPMYVDGPPMNGKWITPSDSLPDPTPSRPIMGYVSQRYFVTPTGFNLLEQWENESDGEAILKQADLRAVESAWSTRRSLQSALFDGIGGKQPDGLQTILQKAAPGSQTGTHLGIDRASPFWKNGYVELAQNFGTLAAGTNICAGFLAIDDLIDASTVGSILPSCIVTTKAVMKNVRRGVLEMGTYQQVITRREDVDLGHSTIMINGVPIGWDPGVAADTLLALHINDKPRMDVNNHPDDTTKYGDVEDVPGTDNIYDLDGSVAVVQNPAIKDRPISAQRAVKGLNEASWSVTSFNLAVPRLSDQAIGGSDNGARWETW